MIHGKDRYSVFGGLIDRSHSGGALLAGWWRRAWPGVVSEATNLALRI